MMRTLKIGFLAGLGFSNMAPKNVVDSLSELGYQGISWPFERFDPGKTSPEERKTLVAITRQSGLSVCEWVVQKDFVHPDRELRKSRIETTLQAMMALSELNVRAPINLFTGPAPWDPGAPRLVKDIPEGIAWSMVYEAFDQLVPLAEKLELFLAVEGVFGHVARDYYTTQELIRHYNSPHLGVNFDPSHGLLLGNDNAWAVRQWGSQIKHVHLKDAVGKPGMPDVDFLFPLLGEGQVLWSEFFRALEDIEYEGFCTVEFEVFHLLPAGPG